MIDSIISFFENASTEQLLIIAAAGLVWFIGGYLLKRSLRKRLGTQYIDGDKDIKFEHIEMKEWVRFAFIAFTTIALVLLAVNLPHFI